MANLVNNTLQEILRNSVTEYGDKIAYVLGDKYKVTYTQLGEKASELGFYLHSKGLIKGDKVVIIGENMPQWGISYFGVTSIGCVMVPVLVDFSSKEMLTVIQHSEAKAIIVSNKVQAKLSDVEIPECLVITMNDFVDIGTGDSIQDYCSNNKETFLRFVPEKTYEEDLACIIYTSGTTGRSKGVMLTNDNLVWDAIACLDLCPINVNDTYLSVLPLAHTYECTLGLILGTMQGSTTHYIDKAPTANVLMPLLKKIRPTIMLTVPLIIEKIFKVGVKPKFVKSPIVKFLYGIRPFQIILHKVAGKKLKKVFGGRLTFFGIGGAAVSYEIEKFLRDAKFPYSCGYGLTETSPMICGLSVKNTKFRSVGPVMKGIEYKLVDINKETGEGEFVVKGRNVMKGYYKDPQNTETVLSEDGWFKTGDLGVIDKYGNLTLKGRSKNMILGASGENIYPEEIESIINEMDGVVESVVYQYKGKLVAQVYLNKEEFSKKYHELLSSALNYQDELMKKMEHYLKELKTKVNSSVAKHSQLSDMELRDEPFEKTATMKIKRFLLNKENK
jgi:long-chain acyl-CoA synthetase